jgi:hypothetical protein
VKRFLIALLLAGCVSAPASKVASTQASPTPNPTPGVADVTGTWVYAQADQQQDCISSGLAISQAGPNLSVRVVSPIAYGSGQQLPPGAAQPADTGGFSAPITVKLTGQAFSFDDADGVHYALTSKGDHLEGTRGAEAVKLYLHPDARPMPCRVPRA